LILIDIYKRGDRAIDSRAEHLKTRPLIQPKCIKGQLYSINQPCIKITLENAPMLQFVSSRSAAKARKRTSGKKSGCENFQLT
jgi:hypothetical protein